MARNRLAAFAVLLASGAALAAPAAAAALNVQIVNKSGKPNNQVYVMLDGGSSSDGRLQNDVGAKLSSISGRRFALAGISGRIYFSFGAPVTAAEPPKARTRYDKVELSYPGVANLTAVDFFGIPFKLQARSGAGKSLGTLAYKASTSKIEKALLKIRGARRALVKTKSGGFARILSPQLSPGSYPSFKRYVSSLAGQPLTVRGSFFGSPPQSFEYSGSLDGNGSVALSGTITPQGGAASPGQVLSVDGPTLPSAIYTVDGPFTVGGAPATVSDNNVYSVIYRDLIAGFGWGYWGGKYGNDSAQWQGRPPFAAARRKKTSYATYNQYAAVIYKHSNAYGFSFSDTGPKKVQLPLDDAATLQITILR